MMRTAIDVKIQVRTSIAKPHFDNNFHSPRQNPKCTLS